MKVHAPVCAWGKYNRKYKGIYELAEDFPLEPVQPARTSRMDWNLEPRRSMDSAGVDPGV